MKKLYSLFAAVVVAATVNAQLFNATFDDVDGTGGNDGSWGGQVAGTAVSSYTTGGTWALDNAYKGDGCLKLGTSSKKGVLTTPSIAVNGSATLTFKAGAWSGNTEKLNLKVSATGGTLDKAIVALVKGSFTTYTIYITDATDVKITFEAEVAANNRFFIDDIKVEKPTAGVADTSAAKVNLVKNTVVSNSILFAAKADVKIVSANGQVVKAVAVNENSAVDVSALPAGYYIVTGTVNGKAVSQKIIKK